MNLLTSSYSYKYPAFLKVILTVIVVLTIFVVGFFIAGLFHHELIADLGKFAPQGEFFGGHVASIVGCITLVVVLMTSYLQLQQERKFKIREYFLSGIAAIAQYDAKTPACPQALRLLDYYAAVALEIGDVELLLILNAVMTSEVRATLEDLDKGKQEIYLSAREARRRIQAVLEAHNRERKGLLPRK